MSHEYTHFKHPFTCIVAGPTGSGKTQFVKKLLYKVKTMVQPVPSKISYYFSEWQPVFDEMKNQIDAIEFQEGLPSIDSWDDRNQLIVLDDLMSETKNNEDILALFTKKSHHRNISIILLTQNLFCQGKRMRSMSLNAHYLIIFNNPRDRSQIMHLGRQLHPGMPKFLEEAYVDATTMRPNGYLFLDLKQETDESLRVQTNIFQDYCEPISVYVKK